MLVNFMWCKNFTMEKNKSSSSSSSLLLSPFPPLLDHNHNKNNLNRCLNSSRGIPEEFIWSRKDSGSFNRVPSLDEPVINLGDFLRGDKESTSRAIELVRAACITHGFFQVTGHGVDPSLIDAAYNVADRIFGMPMCRKMGLRRKEGSFWGYSVAHADRYSSNLPWKETFSFGFEHNQTKKNAGNVIDYFTGVVGKDFGHGGCVYQKYCEAIKDVGLAIMELIAMSLGVERRHYSRIFEEGSSIVRCNHYPPCEREEQTLGTGPHCDPTSLTLLHQDEVGGLQVLVDETWRAVKPLRDAFVINVGDTLMAMTNGDYKSCLHRAVVNKERERRSLAFFMCPPLDHLIRPPQDLLLLQKPTNPNDGPIRKYPDFTWSQLLRFTQSQYRADIATLQSFIQTISNQTPPPK